MKPYNPENPQPHTQVVLDGPSMRARLDARVEEEARVKRQMLEDGKNEKRRKQVRTRCVSASEQGARSGNGAPSPCALPVRHS